MLERFKNLKLVQRLKNISGPRFRWLSFSAKNTLDKSTTDYLEAISGVEDLGVANYAKEMEMSVREQLKKEFPGIENKKSYELIVDAVMHNLMKKELNQEDLDIE